MRWISPEHTPAEIVAAMQLIVQIDVHAWR